MEQNTPQAGAADERTPERKEPAQPAGQQAGTTTEDLVRRQGADSEDEPES